MKVDIIAKLVIMRIENMHITGLFTNEEYHSRDTFNELLKYHLHAICNAKGLKYIEKKSTNRHKNQEPRTKTQDTSIKTK